MKATIQYGGIEFNNDEYRDLMLHLTARGAYCSLFEIREQISKYKNDGQSTVETINNISELLNYVNMEYYE